MTKVLIGLAYACLLASGGVMFWMNAQGGRLHQMLAINTATAAEPNERASQVLRQTAQSTTAVRQAPAARVVEVHMTAKPVMLDASQIAMLDTATRTSRSTRTSATARGATLP